jgi:uncharacterized membrane protein YbhN (UPF0104 family)
MGRWMRPLAVTLLLTLFAVELLFAWPSLTAALAHLRAPDPIKIGAALLAELAAMGAYARMQRRLLRSAGVRVPLYRHAALAYAAHSLSVTLPGGPAFSTRFNFQQMRRFGASPAVASWCIALSGILSGGALAIVTTVSAVAAQGTPPWPTLAGLAGAAVLLTAGIRQLTRRPDTVTSVIRAALARINRIRRRPHDDGVERVTGFVGQLGAVRLAPAHAVAAGGHALLNWLLDAACLWLCLRAVSDTGVSVTQLLLTFCAGYAAATITIVPGGLGVIDSALILGLLAGGVDTGTAIAAVVLYRLISFGFVIGAGWIAWAVLQRRSRHAQPVDTVTSRSAVR